MKTLFETADPPALLATPDQVRELVDRWARKKEVVETWTSERAGAVIGSERREESILLNRAAAAADRQDVRDGTAAPPDPSAAERADVAAHLEQTIDGPHEELTHALMYAPWSLTRDESIDLARMVVLQLRVSVDRPEPESETT